MATLSHIQDAVQEYIVAVPLSSVVHGITALSALGPQLATYCPVLRICDILVRIRLCGSVLLTDGSGSLCFRQWPFKKATTKFLYLTLWSYIYIISSIRSVKVTKLIRPPEHLKGDQTISTEKKLGITLKHFWEKNWFVRKSWRNYSLWRYQVKRELWYYIGTCKSDISVRQLRLMVVQKY